MKRIKKSIYFLITFSFLSATSFADEVNAPSISSNPAAGNTTPGTGALQKYIEKKLDIQNDHGIVLDGAWTGDVNDLFSGGIPDAQQWTTNSLLLLAMTVDTKKLGAWNNGLFGAEILQYNGEPVNEQAGAVQGYNSLPEAPPLNRFEFYEFWFRQGLFDNKLMVRIGKVSPTLDFNNVVKPVPLQQDKLEIPAVSGLIYTPVFVNSTLLGVIPGYYNTAYGVTVNFIPVKRWYLSLGTYDGNLAEGKQTGLTGPNINGSYFHIGETGFAWLLGKYHLPGMMAVGAWRESGLIEDANHFEHGAEGYYLFGSQRLWYLNPGVDYSGISTFYQFGDNNSSVLEVNKFAGAGLTAFGLVPNRDYDSMGLGAAYAWLNQHTFTRETELMLQAYYQAQIIKGIYLEPALSYIPTPGANTHPSAAWAGTARLIILF